MAQFHEAPELISAKAKNISRVISSLREELEAVDWYNQRSEATDDLTVKSIMEHNRNEEIEHACMLMEWLRRNLDEFDEEMKTYLFTEGEITALEEAAGESGTESAGLNIGSMK